MSEFDPIAYIRDVRARPESYGTMQSVVEAVTALHAIRKATTLEAVKAAFQPAAKKAKAEGDTEALTILTEAAKAKRKALEAA